jgi:hypothetical protein
MQKTYWVGDRPGGNWTFQILDQRSGLAVDLTNYISATVILLDPQNNEVEIPDGYSAITDAPNGEVTFLWPIFSLFDTPGRYVMQIQLDSASSTRQTTVQEILVREMGGVTN